MYYLQSRWKIEEKGLYYYGLRNKNACFATRSVCVKNSEKSWRAYPGI